MPIKYEDDIAPEPIAAPIPEPDNRVADAVIAAMDRSVEMSKKLHDALGKSGNKLIKATFERDADKLISSVTMHVTQD